MSVEVSLETKKQNKFYCYAEDVECSRFLGGQEGLEWMKKRVFSVGTNWDRPNHWQGAFNNPNRMDT